MAATRLLHRPRRIRSTPAAIYCAEPGSVIVVEPAAWTTRWPEALCAPSQRGAAAARRTGRSHVAVDIEEPHTRIRPDPGLFGACSVGRVAVGGRE